MSQDDRREPVGSVGEEAAKLFLAFQGLAKESGNEYAEAAAGAATHAASALGGINDHIATGGEDCRYCPLCQVISVVRGTSPEVKGHLTAAGASLMAALAGVMETKPPQRAHRPEQGVEPIDISDGDGWEDH